MGKQCLPLDEARRTRILRMLRDGCSYRAIRRETRAGFGAIARIKKILAAHLTAVAL